MPEAAEEMASPITRIAAAMFSGVMAAQIFIVVSVLHLIS